MKKLLFALGVIVFVPIAFVSCSKGNDMGGTGGGTPTPTPTNNVVIKEFKPSSATVSVVLSGKPEDAAVLFSWETANGSSATFNSAPVSLNDNKTVSVTKDTGFTLRVIGSTTAESTKNAVVTLHPDFAKIVGNDPLAGKRWRLDSILGRPVGSTGPYTDYTDACQRTFVYTFNRDNTGKVEHGACVGGGSFPGTFTFDAANKKILDGMSSSTRWQTVSFNATFTVMEFFCPDVSGFDQRRVYKLQ